MTERLKENAPKLARELAGLIKARNPEISSDALKEETKKYFQFLLSEAISWASHIGEEKENPYSELSKLYEQAEETLFQAQNLSFSAQLHISISTISKEADFLWPDENQKLLGRLEESKEILERALKGLSPTDRGRSEDAYKRHFFEVVLQIFEKASGLPYEKLKNLSTTEERKLKGKLYNLIDLAAPTSTHTRDGIRMFLSRYIDGGRQEKQWVKEFFLARPI